MKSRGTVALAVLSGVLSLCSTSAFATGTIAAAKSADCKKKKHQFLPKVIAGVLDGAMVGAGIGAAAGGTGAKSPQGALAGAAILGTVGAVKGGINAYANYCNNSVCRRKGTPNGAAPE